MIKRISAEESKTLINIENEANTFIAEIDGALIQTLSMYLTEVWNAFHFPKTGYVNYNAYLDWIRDLRWLESDAYVLVIHNYHELISDSPKEREVVLASLENIVLPWWNGEVERCVVGGKAKPFNVYLVE